MSDLLFQDTELNILQIKSNEKHSIVVSGKDGIRWIDNSQVTSIQSAIISFIGNDQINTVALTQNSDYLLANYQKKLSLFSVNPSDFSLKLLRQAAFSIAIIDIYLIQNDRIAVVIGEKGSIIAYDIQNKSIGQEISILSQFNSLTNILGFIFISQNFQWLYIADQFAGVTILKLTLIENSDGTLKNFSMIKAGSVGQLYFVAQVEVTNDNKYLYAFDRWYGIQIVQLDPLNSADPATYPIIINQKTLFWPYYEMNPVFMGTKISIDSNYLIVAVRSHGLIIFDISDRMNPVYYYKIQIEGIIIWVDFTPSQQKIFYTDGSKVLVFQRIESNLNDDFPNTFNGHQSLLKVYTNQYYQWRCYFTPDQQFMIAPQCGEVDILKIESNDPYSISPLLKIPKSGSTRTCNIEFSSDYKYMYQPINTNGKSIDIFDIQSLSVNTQNLQLQNSYLNTNTQRNEDIRFSKDRSLLAMTYAQGIQIIDASDQLNLKLINTWKVPLELNGFPCSVVFSPNNKWILMAMRNIGTYIVLDISDVQNPILVNQYTTLGSEQIIISEFNNVAYLCDGSKGFVIIDLDFLPQIKEISRTPIDGWANFVQLIQEEKFAIISSMDNGMLTIVNIQDKQKPIIFSKYLESTQQSFGSCFYKDLSYGFSVSQYGMRIFPMKSKVKIHSSFLDISRTNKIPQEIKKDANLLVGQTIELQLLMLYASEGAQIMDVLYYNNYQMNHLPYWINFIKSKNSITIAVDKSSINAQKLEDKFLNTLIVKIGIPITKKSFIYSNLPTTSSDSEIIYKYFLDKGFIDGNNLVTSAFNPSNSIEFTVVQLATPELNQKLFEKVRLTMQRGIYYNPILFNTSASLKFNLDNQQQMISTFSTTVQFRVTISNPIMGIFVNKQYSGVIVSLSVSQEEIIFEGPIDNVNRLLNDKIYFSQNSQIISEKKEDNQQPQNFIIYIEDGMNYSMKKTLTFQDCEKTFIHIKNKVELNDNLQGQVNNKYSGGTVPVLDEVSIEFISTTFKDKDNFLLSYQAYLQNNDGTFELLKSDYWFKFSSQQLRFYGTPPNTMFKDSVTIKVEATDGYTTASDTFTLHLDLLPLFYVINLVVSILTPLLSILGIYKYRYLIVNYFNFQNTVYSKEVIKAYQIYFKIIPLLGENLEKSQQIVNSFTKYIERQNSDQEKLLNNLQKHLDQSNSKECGLSKITSKDISPILFSSEQQDQIEVSIQKKNTREVQELQKSIAQKLNNIPEKSNFKNQIERKLCNQEGNIDMDKVIMFIKSTQIEYKYNGKKRFICDDIKEIEDTSNLLHICVFCLLSRYVLTLQPDLLFFYDYLKKYSLALNFYTPNDWYKNYITLNYILSEQELPIMNEVSQTNFLQLFCFKEDSLNLALETLKQSPQYKQFQYKLKQKNLNVKLLKQVIISDALGIVKNKVFRYRKCYGESLLTDTQNIQSIEAYRKSGQRRSCCTQQIYCHYTQYGISSNLKLPYWMHLVNKQGIIILSGRPSNDDADTLQIRIVDKKNYIIKTFNIEILFNKDEAQKNNISTGSLLQNQQERILSNNQSNNFLSIQSSPKISQKEIIHKRQESAKPMILESLKSEKDEIMEGQKPRFLISPQAIQMHEIDLETTEVKQEESHHTIYNSQLKKKKISLF